MLQEVFSAINGTPKVQTVRVPFGGPSHKTAREVRSSTLLDLAAICCGLCYTCIALPRPPPAWGLFGRPASFSQDPKRVGALGSQCAPPVCLSCVSHGQLVEHIHGRLFAEIDDRDKLSPVYGEGYVLLDVSVKVRWRGPREYGRRLNAHTRVIMFPVWWMEYAAE